jgi:EAL domain-containing protein (putative c-di-GMP-specific phosphodiesterase class I)
VIDTPTGNPIIVTERSSLSEGEVIYTLEAMELRFTYEPIIRVHDWMCVGAEAIVSFRHPRRGLIPGDVVMPHVERVPRRVAAVTEVMLDEATATCRRWREKGREFGVWVKLPPGLSWQPDLAERAGRLARANRLPPGALTIQLTEGKAPATDVSMAKVATGLRAQGIRVSLHKALDAGLPVPSTMPLSEVAVTATTEREDAVRAAGAWQAVVADAKRRGVGTACREVRSREEWAAVEAAQCDLAQGAFIARALPAPEFAQWVQRWMPGPTI